MQKKVIALAVAALASGAAMAQSNITVYGIADAVGTYFKTSNVVAGQVKTQQGFDDGAVGSRIGFKGQEDLGSGLKADFLYELGIAPTNNINQTGTVSSTVGGTTATSGGTTLNNFNTRQAYIALTSDVAGQFAVGRFQTPGWEFQANSRPWGGIDPIRSMTNIYQVKGGIGGNGTVNGINSSDRISNAFQYTTPTFAGFKAKWLYSADARSTTSEQNTNDQTLVASAQARQPVYYVSGNYDQGPIAAQIVYRNVGKLYDATAAVNNTGKSEYGIRGSYDFGVAKAGLVYQRQTLNVSQQLTAGEYKVGYMYGGFVTVPVGAKFLATLEAAKGKGDLGTGGYGYMLNGQYLFSKRTSIYAQAGYIKMNNENINLGATVNLGSYGSTGIAAGQHVTAFMAGILHSF